MTRGSYGLTDNYCKENLSCTNGYCSLISLDVGNSRDYKIIDMDATVKEILGIEDANILDKKLSEVSPTFYNKYTSELNNGLKNSTGIKFNFLSSKLKMWYNAVVLPSKMKKRHITIFFSVLETDLYQANSTTDDKAVFIENINDFILPSFKRLELATNTPDLKRGADVKRVEVKEAINDEDFALLQTNKNTLLEDNESEISSIISAPEKPIDHLIVTESMEKRKEHLSHLVHNVPGVIFRCEFDENWTMVYLSDKIYDISGYKSLDFINNKVRSYSSIVFEKDRSKLFTEISNKISRHLPYQLEYRIVTKDGFIRWIHENAEGIYDSNGKILYIDGIITDITDFRMERENLNEKVNLLTGVLNSISDTISVKDKYGVYLACNSEFCNLVGKSYEQIIGKTDYDLFPQEIANKLRTRDILSQKRLKSTKNEEWLTYPNGKNVLFDTRKAPLTSQEDIPLGIVILRRDITSQRRTEKALKESHKQLKDFFTQSLTGFLLMEFDVPITWNDLIDKEDMLEYAISHEKIKMVNQAFLDQYLSTKNDFIGKTPLSIFNGNKDDMKSLLRKTFDNGHYYGEKFEMRKDGTGIWVEGEYVCIYDDEGRTKGHFIVQHDITELKDTHKKLQESENKFITILSSIDDVIWSFSWPDLKPIYISPSAEKVYGCSLDHILANPNCLVEMVYAEDYDIYLDASKKLLEHGYYNEDYRIIRPDGSICWTRNKTRLIYDSNSIPIRLEGITSDISDRKKKEELERNQLIVHEIHHRVKNNLQVIISLLNMQSKLFKQNPDVEGALKDSQNRIRSLSIAHEKLYRTDIVGSIEISDYISSLVNYISQLYYFDSTTIKTELEVEKAYFDMDMTIPLGLIINECVTNSYKHAFKGCKTGIISVSFKRIDDAYELVVSDNGIGMPNDIDFNLINSLGFKIINLLVAQLSGTIELDNSKGTCYKFTFSN
ncbi:PAS domain S-box protein [Methanosalsum natronophilum]|uniref:PAS domain S-box protein n=1 Tax=Methanosalsum natronophilum TaxID=768733 RepID=UPI002168E102|nr:PAS domain S-box protein [Methanosalsum natronophilum]